MPVYEYKCNKCGAEFIYFKMKFADEPICPKCSAMEVTKKISSFSCLGGSGSGHGDC